MQTPPPIPSSPLQPSHLKGGDSFSRFIEGFKGLPGRIGTSPKPQPLKWYDRFPVVFGALVLFWPLGIACVWLTKRFESADKLRLTLVGLAWGFVLLLNTSPTNVKDPNGFKEVQQKHLTTAQIEKIKTTPYYRGQEGIPKETRAAMFAETRDRRLKAAEESLNSGNALAAIKYLSFYTDVLPDKESQDLYERVRKARHEEASALLKNADDRGQGNEPTTLPLLEELDFLVSPSMWYRERLDALKKRTKIYELTQQWIKATGKELRRLSRERAQLEPDNEELQNAAMEADIEDEAEQIAWSIFGARYVLGIEAAKYSPDAAKGVGDKGRFPLVIYVRKEYLQTFSDLGGSQRRDVARDLKKVFDKIKSSSKCRLAHNVFVVYDATQFYDVYNVGGFVPPAGVTEYMLPMTAIQSAEWSSISDSELDGLLKRFGHFKVYPP